MFYNLNIIYNLIIMSKKTQNKQQRQQKKRQRKTQKKQQKCQQKQQKQRKTQKRQQKRQQQRRSRKQQLKKKQRGGSASEASLRSVETIKIGNFYFSSNKKQHNGGNIDKLLTVREYVDLSYDDKKKLHDLINKQKDIYFASNRDLSTPINNLKQKGINIEHENPRDPMKEYIKKYNEQEIIEAIETQEPNNDKLEKLVYPYNPTIEHTTKSNSKKYIKLLNDDNMSSEDKLKFLALLYNTELFLHYFHSYDDINESINYEINLKEPPKNKINLKNPPFLLNDGEIQYLKERLFDNFLNNRKKYVNSFPHDANLAPRPPPPVTPTQSSMVESSVRRRSSYPELSPQKYTKESSANKDGGPPSQKPQPHVASTATPIETGSTTSPEQPQIPHTFNVKTITTKKGERCHLIEEV